MSGKRYDLTYLNSISGGDEEFIIDMIQTFIGNAPAEIKEMKRLFEEQSWSKLGENAHRFAPSLQFLGLKNLKKVINQIEENAFGKVDAVQLGANLNKIEDECSVIIEELKKDFNV